MVFTNTSALPLRICYFNFLIDDIWYTDADNEVFLGLGIDIELQATLVKFKLVGCSAAFLFRVLSLKC